MGTMVEPEPSSSGPILSNFMNGEEDTSEGESSGQEV